MQLAATETGIISSSFPALTNGSSHILRELPATTHHTIERNADIIEPVAITVVDPAADDAFILSIGGQTITRVPLSILFLSGYTNPAENIHTFDISPFFPPIEMVRLQYHVVDFSLESSIPFSLCLRNTYLPPGKRAQLNQEHRRDSSIQQVATYTFQDTSGAYTQTIPFGGFTKGYIVEAPDISQLRHFCLQIGSGTSMHDLINYGPALLAVAGYYLSPRHIWISIDSSRSSSSLFSRTEESFVNGLNHSGIDDTKFSLEFTSVQPASSIRIHSILLNKVSTRFGMGGILYLNDLTPQAILPPSLSASPAPPTNLFNMEAIIDSPLQPDRTMCPITHDTLETGHHYGRCSTCNQCISIEALQATFALQTTATKTCPMCRSTWVDYAVYRVS